MLLRARWVGGVLGPGRLLFALGSNTPVRDTDMPDGDLKVLFRPTGELTWPVGVKRVF